MGFDKSKFLKAGFVPREADVDVPALKDFFPEGSPAVWKVRSLSGHEIAKINEKIDNASKIRALMEGLVSAKTDDQKDAIAALVGNTDGTPTDAIRRIQYLMAGTVSPDPKTIDQDFAGRLLEYFGVTFYAITNKILELSGRGYIPGKKSPSGTTSESGPE